MVRLHGTAQDITERKEGELGLNQAREQLRALSAYHENVLEEEKKRIAQEVHDELGQFLTALNMDIGLIRLRFGQIAELGSKIEDMRVLVEKMIHVVRHIASNLRPAVLDLGLVPAIEWLIEDFSHRWEIRCSLDCAAAGIALDEVRATAVFRVVQESLTNVARHASASEVHIKISVSGTHLRLTVADNGCGFDPAKARRRPSFGLLGMRERMLFLGGSLQVDSSEGNGTTVTIDLPLGGTEND